MFIFGILLVYFDCITFGLVTYFYALVLMFLLNYVFHHWVCQHM